MNIIVILNIIIFIIILIILNKSMFLSTTNNKEVYVVSFAHNCCALAMKNLEKSAYEYGSKKFFNINIDSLQAPEDIKNIIIRNNKGAGFWCWKPYLMEQISKIIPEDSILIYSDASTFFVHDFNNIIDFIDNNNILCFKHDPKWIDGRGGIHVQSAWTKMSAVKHLGYDMNTWCDNGGKSIQFMAGFIGVKNNKIGKEVISEWKELMSPKNLSLYDYSPSELQNCSNFRESRHDQQMLSLLLYKKYNNIKFPSYDRNHYGWVWHERINGVNRHE